MTGNQNSMNVNDYREKLKNEIDQALDVATTRNVGVEFGCPERLREAIRYSLLAPGKRLRPVLTLAACELLDGKREQAIPAACAIEMIHAYSLVHDDLPSMDDDDLRRGRPTCHKEFDEPTAILVGDALISLAFEMIGNLTPPDVARFCCRELAMASGACGMVGGQMDDVSREKGIGFWQNAPEASRELMERIHLRKTGALIRAALRMGGIAADATVEQLEALDQFGIHFGMAFQITDDLLDVLGDEKTVGKRLRKDADKNKWSYPTLLGIDQSKQEAEKSVRSAIKVLESLGNPDSKAFEMLRTLTEQLLERTK